MSPTLKYQISYRSGLDSGNVEENKKEIETKGLIVSYFLILHKK